MDKKSNRTDLLAAGRKKLQQYRQKKDNKGKDGKGKDGKSSGRSSSRADKSEQIDAVVNLVSNADTMNAQSSQLSGNEAETSANSVDINIYSQEPVGDFEVTSVDTPSPVDLSSSELVSAETSAVHEPDTNTLTIGGQVEIDARKFEGSGTSGPTTKFNARNVDILSSSAYPAPEAASDSIVAADLVEVKGLLEGDQESDNPEHPITNVKRAPGIDETLPVSYASNEKLNTMNPDTELIVSATATSGSIEDHEPAEASIPIETTPVGADSGSPKKLNSFDLQSVSNSRYSESEEIQAHLDQQADKEYEETALPEASGLIDVNKHKDDIERNLRDSTKDRNLCYGVQGNSLDLVKLADVLKVLPEDDFRYLIKSRELKDHGNLAVLVNGMVALPVTFQEQLYLANILKDFFHLQLLDQHETDRDLDEEPAFTALLTDVQECNRKLSAELAKCRSELKVAISEKLNFQRMYDHAKEESAGLSAKVDELKIQTDESVTCISSLSAELANCKVSLEASELENGKLLKSLASVSEQRNEFEELMQQYSHDNQKLSLNMADSSSQLATLELEITNLKSSVACLTDERKKLEEESKFLFHEKEALLGDLSDCRREIIALNHENSGLNASVAVLTEETKKLKDHEEFLAQEFERLSTELIVYQDKVSMQHKEHVQLEAELKETMSRLEQMAEENIYLQSSLDIYKARIAETGSRQSQLSSGGIGSRGHIQTIDTDSSVEYSVKEDAEAATLSVDPATVDGKSLSELQPGFSEGTLTLKGYLEGARKIMQKLGKAIDSMHVHSVSLSRSSGKNAAPGISKLIQAFESKANTDDHEPEGNSVTESLEPLDPYFIAKEQLSCLGDVLQNVAHNAEHVDAILKEENIRGKAAIVAYGELEVEVEALKGISNSLEARNIELEVICGALNQHTHDTEAKKTQLEDLCEALKRQYAELESQNFELVKKLTGSHSRISELQIQLKELREGSFEVSSTILNEFETMQRGMREDIFSVEREWNSAFAKLVPIVQKLETAVRSADAYPLLGEVSHDLDVFGRFSLSVSAACDVIESWKPRLEAHDELSGSFRDVEEKLRVADEERSLAIVLLQNISADMVNLLNTAAEHFEDSRIHLKDNSQQDPFDARYYEDLLAKLGTLLGETLQLKDLNSKLSSDLSNKAHDIEELKNRCLDTDTLLKLVLDVKEVLQVHDLDMDLDEAPISHLQSSLSLLIEKYKNLEEQANMSINDVNMRLKEFSELQD